ncbi:MAG TPA: hypothetical protein VG992_01040 [Candidatus Saccharimonadales bacterium]|nr:hypothetical protein [Candidatus Saccharimonadales bacterium]
MQNDTPLQPPSKTHGEKVLQPTPGVAAEIQALQQEAAQTPTSTTGTPSEQGPAKAHSSPLYPEATKGIGAPNRPVPGQHQSEIKATPSQRVAAIVPGVQIYAFVILIYTAYTFIAFSSIFHEVLLRSYVGQIVLGIAAIHIAISVYLLIARNLRTVAALLTALLIVGGLDLLNSVINLSQSHVPVTASTIVSLLISAGLLFYLWNVRTQVQIASER